MIRRNSSSNSRDFSTRGRVLVIDDERAILIALERVLRDLGHDVDTADNGMRGLELARSDAMYDLVMCDIKMPGLGGLEVLRQVRSCDPKLSVLMMTGCATVETAVQAMKLGAFDYITKPFDDVYSLCSGVVSDAVALTRRRRLPHAHLRPAAGRLRRRRSSARAPSC